MCLLNNISTIHNIILHVLYRFFLILHIACAIVPLSLPVSYANEHGATVLAVPVATDDFPDGQEALETLLHHETGLKKPCVYKYKAPQCCEAIQLISSWLSILPFFDDFSDGQEELKTLLHHETGLKNSRIDKCKSPQYRKNAMQLTPNWLKSHYGTLPLSSVREESATHIRLSQYSLAQAIELMESDTCQKDVSFVSVLDKTIANTLKTCNQLSSLPFQGTRKSSINLLEHEPLLCPLNYEEKKVPIILPSNLSKIMLQCNAKDTKKTEKQLPCIHQSVQSTFDQTSLAIPTHITFLDVSNKHHVEYLHQNMIHVSNVMVQIHGRQKVVLMPPVSEQHPYHHLLNSTGQFLFNKEIDLSAADSVLNNELRLAHTTLYSIYLNPGDLLLVPANWFIYRKSLDTSVSLSLNYLSGDTWRLFCFQSEPMEQKKEREYLAKQKRAVAAWANIEKQKNPDNTLNIICACESIQQAISDATQQVLNLRYLWLSSLPNAIFSIPHLKKLDLSYNQFTSFSLSHFPNLVSLDLSSNLLTSFSLNHMQKLESLDLARNRLTSFSLNHVQNLVSLNLEKNQLPFFSLSHMEKLAFLQLENNRLISCSLRHMASLASLHLSYNQLSNFLCCDLPNATYISLHSNRLSHLDSNCISSLNTKKFITLDLRNNPWPEEEITQIQRNLSQRLQHNTTYYPSWFLLIKHIQHNAIQYEDFLHLLSHYHVFPSPEDNGLICPITKINPRQVIFFMTQKKHYIIYDANALSQWIRTYPQKVIDPSTREPLTLKNIIKANQLRVLKYLKQKLKTVFTEFQ